ncbi:DUF2850 domain-containing protein [Vibrio syngnathi]|uniref:N-acetylglutamate synthase n=1 Tax=Vibrio syngnathi TaxID=3034029 RepID=A0AA34XPA6_9VIBR|nr:DUF2850 domain-containing protein [Vibrio syngnathi]ARP39049.1 hypothetical protein K08M4_23160 [Vibrio syngnathi]
MQKNPARKSKIDEIARGLYSGTEQRNKPKLRRKVIERSLMVLALVGSFAVASLFADVFYRVQDAITPNSEIYGTWVEQDVARYAADEFMLSENGVSVRGSIVSTHFDFDGKYFEYKTGNKAYHFRLTNSDKTEMMLVSDNHYNPVFRLKGRIDNSVR